GPWPRAPRACRSRACSQLHRLALFRLRRAPPPRLGHGAHDRLDEHPVRVSVPLLEQVLRRLEHLGGGVLRAVQLERTEGAPVGADHVDGYVAIDAAGGRVLPGPPPLLPAVAEGLHPPARGLRPPPLPPARPG